MGQSSQFDQVIELIEESVSIRKWQNLINKLIDWVITHR